MKKMLTLAITAIMLCTTSFAALVPGAGDVNNDNVISVIDVAKTRAYVVGNAELTAEEIEAGDINADEKLDVVDIMLMRSSITTKNGEIYVTEVQTTADHDDAQNQFLTIEKKDAFVETVAGYERPLFYREKLESETMQDAYDAICEGVENAEERIEFDAVEVDELVDTYNAVVMDHPEYFFLKSEFSYMSNGKGQAVGVLPAYKEEFRTLEKIEEGYKFIDNEINAAVEEANKLDTKLDKIVYIYDYIKARYTYEYTTNSYDIYGALKYNKAVCEGYAETFAYALDKMEIPNILVDGVIEKDGVGHRWNMLYLDGEWYHFDVTWDDNKTEGTFDYNYFAVTTEDILKSRTIDFAEIPASTATDYNMLYRNGLVFEKLDFNTVANSVDKIAGEYNNTIAMRFTDEATYQKAVEDSAFRTQLIFRYTNGKGFGCMVKTYDDLNTIEIAWVVD